jgi:nitrilase
VEPVKVAAVQASYVLDPVGHYNRPDIFRLHVDTSPRPAVTETSSGAEPRNGDPREYHSPDQQARA